MFNKLFQKLSISLCKSFIDNEEKFTKSNSYLNYDAYASLIIMIHTKKYKNWAFVNWKSKYSLHRKVDSVLLCHEHRKKKLKKTSSWSSRKLHNIVSSATRSSTSICMRLKDELNTRCYLIELFNKQLHAWKLFFTSLSSISCRTKKKFMISISRVSKCFYVFVEIFLCVFAISSFDANNFLVASLINLCHPIELLGFLIELIC